MTTNTRRKQFFSEEKNQKTFANGARSTRAGWAQFAQVFCFFFSKKQAFL
jgi:hypothetical protein